MPERNIRKSLETALPPLLFNILVDTGSIAEALGLGAYGVGGFVRDMLIGRKNLDLDIAVEGNCYPVVERLKERHPFKRVVHHRRFLTAELYIDGYRIDIATTRKEEYPRASLPVVEPATLKEDLLRRDFTINTLAVCLNPERFGKVVDHCGGLEDLEKGIIRVLHTGSFREDPVRILRAVRFSERFGFKIEQTTERLIFQAIEEGAPKKASGRRTLDELINILKEERHLQIVERLFDVGFLDVLDSGFKSTKDKTLALIKGADEILFWYKTIGMPSIKKSIIYLKGKAFDPLYSYGKKDVEEWFVYFLCLTDSLSRDGLERFVRWLSLGGKKRLLSIEKRDELLGLGKTPEKWTQDRVKIYEVLSAYPVELLLYFAAKVRGTVEQAVKLYIEELKDIKPLISGTELKALGVKEGPAVGGILDTILKEKLKGRLKSPEEELEFAKRLIGKV
ncbi:MAG TPA: CCA tRNA nucleotidyltransferase [Deltaproteobacteria bacterium]|nr:CCA tRNA nucleotidyltransferase [Deltaproteobacteria bacterium]